MGMPGRVVPWEISWRAVLGLSSWAWVDSGSVDVVVSFPFEVAIGVAIGVGSVIAEGAIVVVIFPLCWYVFVSLTWVRTMFLLSGTIFYIEVRELMYLSTFTYRSANMVIGGRRPIASGVV